MSLILTAGNLNRGQEVRNPTGELHEAWTHTPGNRRTHAGSARDNAPAAEQ